MAPLIDCEVDVQEPICVFRRRRAEAAAFQIPEPVEVCSSDEERPAFGRGRPAGSSDDSDDGGDIGDEGERRILSKKERRQRRKELRSRRRSLSSDGEPDYGIAGGSDGEGSASEIIDIIIDILTPDED